ncbi:ABC transporter permease [Natronospira bacteriovora]|uniref:Iron ABC transporter permease n=1 Tax=Natronospira bacteriovora TaxID=3069753 RepID=A0ABU0W975_9GAMM|nr:iron ABC transporter permease [Natronospira sp. AB-CW4]MDQ2070582.1 iron ABC transporter permease [Natronospira sp. AB-CW4]
MFRFSFRNGWHPRRGLSGSVLAWLLALPVLLPLLVVSASLLTAETEIWAHLRAHVLPEVIVNTLWLVLGVAVGTALLGTALAWLVATCEFPGRRLFAWALLLPMAVPAYVMAFVLIGSLEFAGPLQTLMREQWGAEAGLPAIRSRGGVILALVLVLYPYVYLIVRNAFATQGGRALEVARSLGLGPWQGFFRVALPLARPWIAAGVLLAMMETLADFGTVAAFNYETFTTAIYKAWYDLQSIEAAMQLSSILVIVVLLILVFEQLSRQRTRYTQTGAAAGPRFGLKGFRAWLASGFCFLVLLCAFLLPGGQLLWWAFDNLAYLDGRYLGLAGRSLGLSVMAAAVSIAIGLMLAFAVRRAPGLAAQLGARVATVGYAVPGPVLAVGLALPLIWFSGLLQEGSDWLFGEDRFIILLQGSLLGLIVAYVGRFLAVAHSPVNASLMRVSSNLDDAARGMGLGPLGLIRKVHLPLVRGGLITGAILVFVDVMKEMPITLMMRPFGWDTLAVRIYELTVEGHWERAALPAVTLVLVGLVPVILLTRRLEEGRRLAMHRDVVEEDAHAA